jgi:hypothetical protein
MSERHSRINLDKKQLNSLKKEDRDRSPIAKSNNDNEQHRLKEDRKVYLPKTMPTIEAPPVKFDLV